MSNAISSQIKMAKKESGMWSKQEMGEHKMWTGILLFIFGLALWWTFVTYGTLRWDIGLMIMGIVVFLKGLYMKSM